MTAEMELYMREMQRLLDRLCRCVDGLGEAELNWRPPAPEANSLYVIATHMLGNAEAWVLGIICGESVDRDRDAEFRASGADARALTTRAGRLSKEFARVLRALPPSALDDRREPRLPLRGTGPAGALTVREALMRVLVHALMHMGHMEVTRDLAIGAQLGAHTASP